MSEDLGAVRARARAQRALAREQSRRTEAAREDAQDQHDRTRAAYEQLLIDAEVTVTRDRMAPSCSAVVLALASGHDE